MKLSTDIFIQLVVPDRTKLVRLQFEFDDEANKLSADEFWNFCSQNDKMRIELTQANEITVTFPKSFAFSQNSLEILLQLGSWEKIHRTGKFFNHLVGYVLPNGHIFRQVFLGLQRNDLKI